MSCGIGGEGKQGKPPEGLPNLGGLGNGLDWAGGSGDEVNGYRLFWKEERQASMMTVTRYGARRTGVSHGWLWCSDGALVPSVSRGIRRGVAGGRRHWVGIAVGVAH